MDEKRLEALEKRLAEVERKAEKAESALQIENLMGKHNFLYAAGQGKRIVPELYASDDGISVEYGASGVYRTRWKVNTFYVSETIPGRMSVIAAANRFLEISEDGKTARGIWMLIGNETDAGDLGPGAPDGEDARRLLLSCRTEDGKRYQADWLWQKCEVHFVREADRAWKIHDLHISEYFRCPFDRDWVRYAQERLLTDGVWLEYKFESLDEVYPPDMRHENLPFDETTYHWQYMTHTVPELQFEL